MEYSPWKIQMIWGRGSESTALTWQILDNPIALLWVKLFNENLLSQRELKSRYIGFTKGPRHPEFVGNLLNECIETINRDGRYYIKEKFELNYTQDLLNEIHNHFTCLIGDESFKSEYWMNSSQEVHSAICGLNDYVHELESWERAISTQKCDPDKRVAYVTSEFFEAPSFPMKKEWDKYFSMESEFGELCLHYDQIGKTWMEVLIDKDEAIVDEDIRPLDILTGSFNINFFETTEKGLKDSMREHAQHLGVDLDDPTLRLGQCCIGKIVMPDEYATAALLVDHLAKRIDISALRLIKDEKIVRGLEVAPTQERYFYSPKE